MALPKDGQKYELLRGELVVSPTGFQHGYISVRLASMLIDFVLRHRLGIVVDSSTGFRMKNGDCLSPDISFVCKERLANREELTDKFFPGAPDLAIEVLSPRESAKSLAEKLVAYFSNGTRVVWVISPKVREVFVHHSPKRPKRLGHSDCLDAEDLLPGFTVPVATLFELPDFAS